MKKTAILWALLLAPAAFADGFSNGSTSGSSSSVDLTAVTTAVSPATDNSVSVGDLTHRYVGVFGIALNSGASTMTITSAIADGAAAKGVVINGSNLANASSKPLVIQAAGTDKWFFRTDGAFAPNAFGGGTLGTNALYWQTLYTNEIIAGNGTLQAADGTIRFQFQYTGGTTFISQAAASGVAFKFKTVTTATSGNWAEHYKDNGTTLIYEEDFGGSTRQGAVTLRTCAIGTEGLISRDVAAGGTTGHITRMCMCTSDGAGTPVYKWQNIVTGTLGNTTTCQD